MFCVLPNMFFILSRFFAWLASPVFWIVVFLGMALIVRRKRRAKTTLISLALVFTFLLSVPKVSSWATNLWVPADSSVMFVDTTKHYVYAFVPGGVTNYDEKSHRIEYGECCERLMEAYVLLRQGVVDSVIITGDGGPTHAYSAFMEHTKQTFDIDVSRIIVEPAAKNTYQNFEFTVNQVGLEKLNGNTLVINSGMYMRRTMLCADLVGLEADFYVVDFVYQNRVQGWTHCIPSPYELDTWLRLWHEIIGYLSYWCVYS